MDTRLVSFWDGVPCWTDVKATAVGAASHLTPCVLAAPNCSWSVPLWPSVSATPEATTWPFAMTCALEPYIRTAAPLGYTPYLAGGPASGATGEG